MKRKSVDLLIQGPLNEKITRHVELNAGFFERIIVSTWQPVNEIESMILEKLFVLQARFSNLVLTINEQPTYAEEDLPRKFFLQINSIANGLKQVSAEHIIKSRTDEVFNLEKFIDFIQESKYEFQFSNFIVRDWRYHSFHMSDHLFASPTKNLTNAIAWLTSGKKETLVKLLGNDWDCPESLLGYALLASLTEQPTKRLTPWKGFLRFSSHFDLFDIGDLSFFEVQAKSANSGYLSDLTTISLEAANIINWNHFTRIWQLRPSFMQSYFRRKIQPEIRQWRLHRRSAQEIFQAGG